MNLNEINTDSLVYKTFDDIGWIPGRIITYSKSKYIEDNPNSLVIFNAKVVVLDEGLVWSGDLDIDVNENILSDIAITTGKKLYILKESDILNNPDMDPEHIIKKAVTVI